MDIAELDINAVCFGILCNFPQFCGEERAKEAAELVRALYAERETLRADLARVTAERDAAIECLKNKCPFCRKYLTCQGRTINNECWEFFGLKED